MRGVLGALGQLVIGVIAALATAPAGAVVYTATFTGTVARAADFGGLFGPPGTDISGLGFTAVYRVDTAPGRYSSGNAVSAEYDSGSSHGLPAAVRATLTIGGRTQAISGLANGIVVQEDGVRPGLPVIPNGDEVYYEASGSTGPYNSTQMAFVIADTTASFLDTRDFSARQEISFTPTSAQDSRFSINDNGAQAYGSLFATHLSVRNAVPEPASMGADVRRFRTGRGDAAAANHHGPSRGALHEGDGNDQVSSPASELPSLLVARCAIRLTPR